MEEALDKKLNIGNSGTSVGKFQRKGCYYTSIPRVVKCKGISGQELTSLNLDKVGIHLHLNIWFEKVTEKRVSKSVILPYSFRVGLTN